MSLVVKCMCGMILDFDIRSPGLIVVRPCEDCRQRIEDKKGYTVGAGVSAEIDAVLPGQMAHGEGPGENKHEEFVGRVMKTRKSLETGSLLGGGNDDNDPKNPIDRRL